ncbi:hypothetical protein K474DRAFT_888570 [Panus rudis PR-1116 ss-1]|nr:hypothetical protein K474DRAFT_888570 [Panus rudis PR-1116 ss-1]
MPPLVDKPASMTFTFATDMTPITYSSDPTNYEVIPEHAPQQQQMLIYDPPASPAFEPTRPSHAKKRDASYIPRPPNAFILFRSSFIKAQHIPGEIEGNHSALSKIIGKYWKALPRKEREVWEAKAIVAQAEHRKKYPDWRFRPSTNMLAKVKDGPRRRINRKGRGEAEKEVRSREKRCDKIADLLVAGKVGTDLAVAIEQYDCETGAVKKVKEEGGGVVIMQVQEQETTGTTATAPHPVPEPPTISPPVIPAVQPASFNDPPRKDSRSLTPDETRFRTPLTAMFKRSSSAPASQSRTASSDPNVSMHGSPCPAEKIDDGAAFDGQYNSHSGCPPRDITTSPTRPRDVNRLSSSSPSVPGFTANVADCSQVRGGATNYLPLDTYTSVPFDVKACSPATSVYEQDVDEVSTPAQSPLAFDYITGYDQPDPVMPFGHPNGHSYSPCDFPSSYSSLNGWGGNPGPKQIHPQFGNTSISPPYVAANQQPLIYEPDRVMKDAFAAAAYASYEDWGVDLGGTSPSFSLRYGANSADLESLQHYAQGWQNMARLHDNQCQLF